MSDGITIHNISGETFNFVVSNGLIGTWAIGYLTNGATIRVEVTPAWWDVYGIPQRPLASTLHADGRLEQSLGPETPTGFYYVTEAIFGIHVVGISFRQRNVDSNGTVTFLPRTCSGLIDDNPSDSTDVADPGGPGGPVKAMAGDAITVHNRSSHGYLCAVSNNFFAEVARSIGFVPSGATLRMPSGPAWWDFHAMPQMFPAQVFHSSNFSPDNRFMWSTVKFRDVNSLATVELGDDQASSRVGEREHAR